MSDPAVHWSHCHTWGCEYDDARCPVTLTLVPEQEEAEAEVELELSEEYAVRNPGEDWIYALPRILPKDLYGRRGSREAAEWHRQKLAGKDGDVTGFEIVRRPVGPWEVVQ